MCSKELWLSTLVEVSRQFSRADEATQGKRRTSEPWPQDQWSECFKILVYEMPESVRTAVSEKDDLVFFVSLEDQSVLTRRKTASLPDIGSPLDWKASVMLYLIMHTEYHCIFALHTDTADGRSHVQSNCTATNRCLALPHLSSSTVSSMVFHVQDLLTPMHVERAAFPVPPGVHVPSVDRTHSETNDSIDTSLIFTLEADIKNSWDPSEGPNGNAEETCDVVSCGMVSLQQLESSCLPRNQRPTTIADKFLRLFSPPLPKSESNNPCSSNDGIVQLVDPSGAVVFRVSVLEAQSAYILRVLDISVIDIDIFAKSLFQSLYQRLRQ